MKNKKKILVVDDGEEMLEGIKIVLEDEGYNVMAIADNTQVFKKVKQFNPGLVLIDYMMPGADGGQITKRLKSNALSKEIPIMMFSASQQIEKVAKESGADDFLAKPFELDLLIQKVEKLTS